jgi:beta-lactamase class C
LNWARSVRFFNATLAGYAQATGKLSLDDHPAQYFPALKNTAVNNATLLNLGTYTAGGFPLQFPDQVIEQQDMLKYFQTWQPKTRSAHNGNIPIRVLG